MNVYSKYAPNVFLAKCADKHEKGSSIILTTRYGKENESIIHNLIHEKDGYYYYSITRADGFDTKEWAMRRAMKYTSRSISAYNKAIEHKGKSDKDKSFLSLLEPIKIGHHSERRHRKAIQNAQDQMFKFVEYYKKSEELESRVAYWESRSKTINLSMPDSLEYFELKLHRAMEVHKGLKDGSLERVHSYSLTYAKKDVNVLKKKYELAQKLWA